MCRAEPEPQSQTMARPLTVEKPANVSKPHVRTLGKRSAQCAFESDREFFNLDVRRPSGLTLAWHFALRLCARPDATSLLRSHTTVYKRVRGAERIWCS